MNEIKHPYICKVYQTGQTPVEIDEPQAADLHFLLHAPHSAVQKAQWADFLYTLGIPEDACPPYFECFCHTNGDQGTEEYTQRAAALLTDPSTHQAFVEQGLLRAEALAQATPLLEELKIGVLLGQCHRSILDLNRDFQHNPTQKGELTPPMPTFIREHFPESVERAHALHQLAMQWEDTLYPMVCQDGRYGVLNAHTYMPFSPQIQSLETMFEDVYKIYSTPSLYTQHMKEHKRPDIELLTADKEGDVLAPASYVEALTETFQKAGYPNIKENDPFYHVNAAMGSQRARRHRGYVTILEVSRDLFLPQREDYQQAITQHGVITVDPQQVERIAVAIASATIQYILTKH
ncbi:MAG: hypothetical protein CL920_00390 [Deltaproteobacteria bacterium]|nr:hypothetical protein [Deltaproteobacteria bacterium]